MHNLFWVIVFTSFYAKRKSLSSGAACNLWWSSNFYKKNSRFFCLSFVKPVVSMLNFAKMFFSGRRGIKYPQYLLTNSLNNHSKSLNLLLKNINSIQSTFFYFQIANLNHLFQCKFFKLFYVWKSFYLLKTSE